MTSGGPNHATEVMSTYMYYQSFNILNYGYASAIGVVLMLLCILSVGISNRVFKTDETVQEVLENEEKCLRKYMARY